MGIMKLENVREFVEKHTDEQCGLDVANVEVWDNFDSIRITVNHKNKKQQGKMYKKSGSTGMKQECNYYNKDYHQKCFILGRFENCKKRKQKRENKNVKI